MMLAPIALLLATKSESFAETWDQVASAIRGTYYARVPRKDEMNKLLDKYGAIASKATSRDQFRSSILNMIAEFKDSHFDFLTDEDQGYYLMDSLVKRDKAVEVPNIGAWFKKSPDGYTVQMVLNASAAEKADLRKGDIIESVDGKDFAPISSLTSAIGKDAIFKVRRKNVSLEKKIAVSKDNALEMFLEASRNSSKIIEINGKKIGYFHLWTCANESFRNALSSAVYGKLSGTDAMILDIRDGFGGRPEGFLDPFFRPEVELRWNTSPTVGTSQLFGYQRPLIVLINGGSRSAKEIVSYLVKKSNRGKLIGTQTAGNVLGTFPRRINAWSYIEIPIVEVLADNIRLEGNGVKPDIEVPKEYDDNGKDLVLEKALSILKNVPSHTSH